MFITFITTSRGRNPGAVFIYERDLLGCSTNFALFLCPLNYGRRADAKETLSHGLMHVFIIIITTMVVIYTIQGRSFCVRARQG